MRPGGFTLYRSSTTQNSKQTLFPTAVLVGTVEDLKKAVSYDHTPAELEGGKRRNENFKSADCMILDFDNSDSDDPAEWIQCAPGEMNNRFPGVECYIVPSRNHMKQKGNKTPRPKFHAYFPIQPIKDREELRRRYEEVHALCPLADPALKDASRMIFGVNNPDGAQYVPGSRTLVDWIQEHAEEAQTAINSAPTREKANAENAPQTAVKRAKVPDSSPWDGVSTIPEGGRHETVLGHMAHYIKRNHPAPEEIRAELERAFASCEDDLPEAEKKNLEKAAFEWLAKMDADPDYYPDLKEFIATEQLNYRTQIEPWAGITADEKIILAQINGNPLAHNRFIDLWTGTGKSRFQGEEKEVREQLRLLLQCSGKTNKTIAERREIVGDMFIHSRVYERAAGYLTFVQPDGLTTLEALLLDETKTADRWTLSKFKAERGGFLHEACGKAIAEEFSCVKNKDNGQLFMFINGSYTCDPDEIDAAVSKHVVRDATKAQRQEALTDVKNLFAKEVEREADPRYIVFKNGVLDIKTGILTPPDPDIFVQNIIPHDYDPNAPVDPLVNKVLEQWCCGDHHLMQTLLEAAGCCLYRGKIKRVFFLTGDGNNGKSIYLEMLKVMLGVQNVSTVPAEKLSERFMAAQMFGKLANLAAENKPDYISNTEVLKQMGGNDLMFSEHKFGQPFKFSCYATGIFSYNELPRFRDPTGAVMNRILPIPFQAAFVFDPAEVDEANHVYPAEFGIEAKLTTPSAIAYFLRLAVEGLKAVVARGADFEISDKGKQDLEEIDRENNHHKAFIEDMRERENDPAYPIGRNSEDVQHHYEAWCYRNGLTEWKYQTLSKRIQREFKLKTQPRKIEDKTIRFFIAK